MPSPVTVRFVECHDRLKGEGRVKSSRQFAIALDYLPQNLSDILKGKRDAPLELIRKGVEIFRINPNFLYSGQGAMFLDEAGQDGFSVLSVAVDGEGNERIIHVPIAAQAGYAQEMHDPVFFNELPSYALPDRRFQHGTYRSFDVSGDSMYPSLEEGDRLVCSIVEPNDWINGLHDHHVYVIVTRSSIFVKRVVNNLQRHRHLELVSDNTYYKNIRVNIAEVRELWHVDTKISAFSHSLKSSTEDKLAELEATIFQQTTMIKHLNKILERLTVQA